MSKLIRYCEGVMEATWLTALLSVPTFYALWGQSLQDAKTYLLRSLAILLVTAWTIRFVALAGSAARCPNFGRGSFLDCLRTPLIIPTIAFALILVIATFFSLAPWVSFWGTAVRRTGTYTYLSCLAFFAVMAAMIRSERQVSRVITVLILTSLPISFYAIAERSHTGPVINRETGLFRVGSTLGNPVFLAAYLIMVVPLTLSRICLRVLEFVKSRRRSTSDRILPACYGLIAILQFCAIFFTLSRGPMVGLLVSSLTLFVMASIYFGQRRLVFGAVAAGAFLAVALGLLAWPGSPFRKLVQRSDLERFSTMLDPKADTSGRTAIWNLAVEAARFDTVMPVGEGRKDRFASLRFLLGYGPETAQFVTRPYIFREYNVALTEHLSCDRFHSEFWDTLVTTGILGLTAYLSLTWLVLYFGCQWLGMISSRRQRWVFWMLLLSGAALGALFFGGWRGWGFVGVGLRFGGAVGLVAYLLWLAARNEFVRTTTSLAPERALPLMALICGILAHLIETNFSFGVETTLLYFWAFVALMLVIGHLLPSRAPATESPPVPDSNAKPMMAVGRGSVDPGPSTQKKPGSVTQPPPRATPAWRMAWESHRTPILGGLAAAAILMNLGVMLIPRGAPGSAWWTLVHALTRMPGNPTLFTESLILAIMLTTLGFAFIWAKEHQPAVGSRPWLRAALAAACATAVFALPFWFALATHASGMLALDAVTPGNVGQFLKERMFLVELYYGFLLLIILLLADRLAEKPSSISGQDGAQSGIVGGVALALAVGGLIAIQGSNLKWARVEAIDHWAESFQAKKQWPVAAAICEAAIKSTPRAEHQYFFLGKVLTEQAAALRSPDERQAQFMKADDILARGSKLRAIDHAFLVRRGNLYLKWAETESAPERRSQLGRKALELFGEAFVLDPGNDDLCYRMGYTAMVALSSPTEARPWLLRSVELNPRVDEAHGLLGDTFVYQSLRQPAGPEKEVLIRNAVTNYQHAVAAAGTNELGARYRYTVALAKVFLELTDWSSARTAYEQALGLSQPQDRWANEERLAHVYAQLSDRDNAARHLARAIEIAPMNQRSNLIQRRNALLSTP